jgi:hypothetical protein
MIATMTQLITKQSVSPFCYSCGAMEEQPALHIAFIRSYHIIEGLKRIRNTGHGGIELYSEPRAVIPLSAELRQSQVTPWGL